MYIYSPGVKSHGAKNETNCRTENGQGRGCVAPLHATSENGRAKNEFEKDAEMVNESFLERRKLCKLLKI